MLGGHSNGINARSTKLGENKGLVIIRINIDDNKLANLMKTIY